jgi:hypothetical protein
MVPSRSRDRVGELANGIFGGTCALNEEALLPLGIEELQQRPRGSILSIPVWQEIPRGDRRLPTRVCAWRRGHEDKRSRQNPIGIHSISPLVVVA